MNLWIRSQDKESITKISNIQYTENKGQHFIATYYDNLKILGQYKTKARALEVLNEIQEVLMPKIKVLQSVNAENNIDDLVFRPTIQECGKMELLQYSDYVYEMPKE